jgi:hypothetical protein
MNLYKASVTIAACCDAFSKGSLPIYKGGAGFGSGYLPLTAIIGFMNAMATAAWIDYFINFSTLKISFYLRSSSISLVSYLSKMWSWPSASEN